MRRRLTLLACALVLPVACAQAPMHHTHRFTDADAWARVFDDPARDTWQKPHEVIRALALKPDAVVADIGAGTGYFAVRLARMLPAGTVYAQDVEPDMVRHLAARAEREKLPNMLAVAGAFDDPKLPGKVDLALLVDVYHHIDAREQYFTRLRASLNDGGRVAIVDYTPEAPEGPPKAMRLPAPVVKAEMARAGYVLQAEHTFLPRQFLLVFAPR